MILELILIAAIGQEKQPPKAPVDDVQIVKIDDKDKKIEELRDQLNEQFSRAQRLETDIINLKDIITDLSRRVALTKPKYIMADKNGKFYQNERYDRLVFDVELINKGLAADNKSVPDPNPPQIRTFQPQQQFYIPQMNVGAACSPGGS